VVQIRDHAGHCATNGQILRTVRKQSRVNQPRNVWFITEFRGTFS
jgi:hypothetical protein